MIDFYLQKKINKKGYSQIESESEYYYAVGQLVRYYISLSKAKDKNHSLANPFFNASNDSVIKNRLEQFFKKYNYAIKAEMETTMEIQMWKEILTPYDLAVEDVSGLYGL